MQSFISRNFGRLAQATTMKSIGNIASGGIIATAATNGASAALHQRHGANGESEGRARSMRQDQGREDALQARYRVQPEQDLAAAHILFGGITVERRGESRGCRQQLVTGVLGQPDVRADEIRNHEHDEGQQAKCNGGAAGRVGG